MQINFKGTVSKAGDWHNEDSFGLSLFKSIAVMCDGATESFDSRSWSKFLVKHFIRQPAFGRRYGASIRSWVSGAVESYAESLDVSAMSWSQELAFSRGSYSTLIGVKQIRNGNVLVSGVGDSIVAVLDGADIKKTWPYDSAESFNMSPILISTLANKNNALPKENQMTVKINVSRYGAPVLLCMTDALGQWLLSEQKKPGPSGRARSSRPIRKLLAIRTNLQFETFVQRERKHGRMRVDDTTLIHISLDQS
jgi:hypothetical protein